MFPEICVSGATRGVRGKRDYLEPGHHEPLDTEKGVHPTDTLACKKGVGKDDTSGDLNTVTSSDGVRNEGGACSVPAPRDGLGATDPISRPEDINTCLAMVRLAFDVHGKDVAQALWAQFGLPMPSKPTRMAKPLSEKGLQVSRFLLECAIPDPQYEIAAADLYEPYRRWAVSNDLAVLELPSFGRYAIAAGCRRRRSNGSIYIGIRLRCEASANA